MKKIALLLLAAAGITTSYQCKPPAPESSTFSFTIEEDNSFTNLPALHSFGLGETEGAWLLVGGRTNGFHGFNLPDQNFPFKTANQNIFVYNLSSHTTESISVDVFPTTLKEQYSATNMLCRQVDSFLYIAGGYGVIKSGQPDSAWVTHSTLSRINISRMVRAIHNHDTAEILASAVYLQDSHMASTGGELFKMSDGNFYLCVGHKFTGAYGDTSAATKQEYLDEVRVFQLTETDSSIALAGAVQAINDGLNDTITQFHRRDLVVAPNVMTGGNGYGISILGGVFTYTSGCPSCNGGNPFRYPIYIMPGSTPAYKVDSAYTQASNIYSAPNLQMYDSVNDIMFTTIFGGLGDTLYPGKTDTTAGDNASFTKLVLTVAHNNSNGTTSSIYNANGMPAWVGSEGIFVKAQGVNTYKNNPLGIIDYNQLPNGNHVIGYIYGGIYSNNVQWNPPQNPTTASAKVYKVMVNKH